MAALIGASSLYVASASGPRITITRTTAGADIPGRVEITLPTTMFYNADMALTVDAQIGGEIVNLASTPIVLLYLSDTRSSDG